MITFALVVATIFWIGVAVAGLENKNVWQTLFGLVMVLLTGYGAYYRFNLPDPPPTQEQIVAKQKQEEAVEEAKTPKIFSKTDDGCTVYKFKDNGYSHYFARCGKEEVTTNNTVRSEKSTRVESIKTN